MLYLRLDSSGEGEGKKKRLIRHMQLYFSLYESKTESMTVSCSHKMVHLQGTGYQAQHLTALLNQGQNSASCRRGTSHKVSVSSLLPLNQPHSLVYFIPTTKVYKGGIQ